MPAKIIIPEIARAYIKKGMSIAAIKEVRNHPKNVANGFGLLDAKNAIVSYCEKHKIEMFPSSPVAQAMPEVECHSGEAQLQPIQCVHLAKNFADFLAKENGWEEPGDYAQCEENAQQLIAFLQKQYPKHFV